MDLVLILTTALALSMDAFAVAISCGVSNKTNSTYLQIKIALFFGVFQAIMPLIGWALASSFAKYLHAIGNWIAFGLLFLIGIKMILEGRNSKCNNVKKLTNKYLLVLAIATSIDALAMGVSFLIIQINIFLTVIIIGLITFVLSFFGAKFGQNLGNRYKAGAGIIGGIILIVIGTKILIEHLLF